MEIVGEQDGRDVRLLGAAFGHGAGREHTQHRQQQRQKNAEKRRNFIELLLHTAKRESGKDSLFRFFSFMPYGFYYTGSR